MISPYTGTDAALVHEARTTRSVQINEQIAGKIKEMERHMRYRLVVFAMTVAAASAVFAQTPQQPVDPSAPVPTLDEKISLTTDDVKLADALESAQKAYIAATKSIQDHQNSTKAVIEKEHPGWILENGPQGWHLIKKPEQKPEAKPQPVPNK